MGWLWMALRRILLGRPHEIVIGRGHVLIGDGVKDGRPFVLIAHQSTPGRVGQTLPAMVYPAGRRDTVIWIDGPTDHLIASIRSAASNPKDNRP